MISSKKLNKFARVVAKKPLNGTYLEESYYLVTG
jgi:hypothetical protein